MSACPHSCYYIFHLKFFFKRLVGAQYIVNFVVQNQGSIRNLNFFFFFGKFSSQHLESVIRARIPSIISMINKTIDELEAELDRMGRPIGGDQGVSKHKATGIIIFFFSKLDYID